MQEREASDLLETTAPADVVVVVVFRLEGSNLEFLLARKDEKKYKNRFSCPGGRLEAGESVLQAGLRELDEETGISFSAGDLKKIKDLRSLIWDGRARYRFSFFSLFFTGKGFIKDMEKVHNWGWYSLEDVYKLMRKKLLMPATLKFFQAVSEDDLEKVLY
jgi:ADP-ribose pyrophosphatase YjhB (NUDIX family)